MIFVYSDVAALEGKEKVGTKQCVALLQHYLPLIGHTSSWSEGDDVFENEDIEPGTAIATFVKGRYPNQASGNHAALFLKHDLNGFWIMDQWSSDTKKKLIGARLIQSLGKPNLANGAFYNASNNADAYSIIER